MTEEDEGKDRVVLEFLVRLVEDLRRGEVATLKEYQEAFLGSDEAIAAEYAAVTAGAKPTDDAKPRTIGPFEIVRELGRGGQGVVYLAVDQRIHRAVALKVVSRSVFHDESARLRLQREAELASRLDDRGICAVYEVGRDGHADYIAMRYLPGGTLGARMRVATFDTTAQILDIVRLIERVARSLHTAHEAGIVHRDIKPANIMLDDAGRPVVVDFGFARDEITEHATLTATGVVYGTPPYMSPEQLSGVMRPVDRRTDVYSLGIVLYQLLTGVLPHEAPTAAALLLLVRSTPPRDPRRLNSRISRDLAVVTTTALEADLNHRYATAQDFADDLLSVLENRPVSARPPGLLRRTTQWVRRNRIAASIMTFIIFALGTTGWFLNREAGLRQDLEQLTDGRMVEELRDRETLELLPIRAEVVELGERWLADADEVIRRRRGHVRFRDRLRALTSPTREQSWTLDQVENLISDIDDLANRVAGVRDLTARARTFDARWSEGEAAERWTACIEAVKNSDKYGGLELTPQHGLVPLKADPNSGLWEFFVLESGEPPAWDMDKWADERWDDGDWDIDAGGWRIEPETGVVLVLLPGGTFQMGCPWPAPTGKDQFAQQRPRHTVTLEPFFMGKFELTQAQWMRLHDGDNPAWYPPGTTRGDEIAGDEIVTLAHPIENVSRAAAIEATRRLGVVLPTEAQWEYACRGGTVGGHYRGNSVTSLSQHENLFAGEVGSTSLPPDGFIRHAIVGSLSSNPFGLHDMIGNVAEWCLDIARRDYDDMRRRAGDGLDLRSPLPTGDWIARGSSFLRTRRSSLLASYRFSESGSGKGDLGARAARAMTP